VNKFKASTNQVPESPTKETDTSTRKSVSNGELKKAQDRIFKAYKTKEPVLSGRVSSASISKSTTTPRLSGIKKPTPAIVDPIAASINEREELGCVTY